MFCRIPTYALKLKVIRVLTIDVRYSRKHVVTMIIDSCKRSAGIARCEEFERLRRNRQSLIWKNFYTLRMRDRDQLKSIEEHGFLELVRHANFITPVALAK